MQPHLPEQRPRRLGARNLWVGIWSALALAGIMLIVAPLVVPSSTPRGQAQDTANEPASATWLPTSSPQPGNGAAQAPVPIWLNAPRAHIIANIIPVGVDAHGAMAAPEGANNDPIWFQTFWWDDGVMPGQVGNAVIAGHLDRKDGSPAIFWKLNTLRAGDAVLVRNALGVTLRFVVTAVKTFATPTGGAANPVMQRIFGPAQTANLNLITCSGDWTGTEFNKKLVVFTTLAP